MKTTSNHQNHLHLTLPPTSVTDNKPLDPACQAVLTRGLAFIEAWGILLPLLSTDARFNIDPAKSAMFVRTIPKLVAAERAQWQRYIKHVAVQASSLSHHAIYKKYFSGLVAYLASFMALHVLPAQYKKSDYQAHWQQMYQLLCHMEWIYASFEIKGMSRYDLTHLAKTLKPDIKQYPSYVTLLKNLGTQSMESKSVIQDPKTHRRGQPANAKLVLSTLSHPLQELHCVIACMQAVKLAYPIAQEAGSMVNLNSLPALQHKHLSGTVASQGFPEQVLIHVPVVISEAGSRTEWMQAFCDAKDELADLPIKEHVRKTLRQLSMPLWFKELDPIIQAYLENKYIHAASLGFNDTPYVFAPNNHRWSSTFRMLPEIRNGYISVVIQDKLLIPQAERSSVLFFRDIRHGHLTVDEIGGRSITNLYKFRRNRSFINKQLNKETIRLTQNNIKQAILHGMVVRFMNQLDGTQFLSNTTQFELFIQTLTSPLSTHLIDDGEDPTGTPECIIEKFLLHAMQNIQQLFNQPEQVRKFIQHNKTALLEIYRRQTAAEQPWKHHLVATRPANAAIPQFKQYLDDIQSIVLYYSNHPVNQLRFRNSTTDFDTRNIVKFLTTQVTESTRREPLNPVFRMAQQALKQYQWYQTRSLGKVDTQNCAIEMAALIRIAAFPYIPRSGGCKSGKDREGVCNAKVHALLRFYATQQCFPEPDNKEHKDWYDYLTALDLVAYPGMIANLNSPGASALKSESPLLKGSIRKHRNREYLRLLLLENKFELTGTKLHNINKILEFIASLNRPFTKPKNASQYNLTQRKSPLASPTSPTLSLKRYFSFTSKFKSDTVASQSELDMQPYSPEVLLRKTQSMPPSPATADHSLSSPPKIGRNLGITAPPNTPSPSSQSERAAPPTIQITFKADLPQQTAPIPDAKANPTLQTPTKPAPKRPVPRSTKPASPRAKMTQVPDRRNRRTMGKKPRKAGTDQSIKQPATRPRPKPRHMILPKSVLKTAVRKPRKHSTPPMRKGGGKGSHRKTLTAPATVTKLGATRKAPRLKPRQPTSKAPSRRQPKRPQTSPRTPAKPTSRTRTRTAVPKASVRNRGKSMPHSPKKRATTAQPCNPGRKPRLTGRKTRSTRATTMTIQTKTKTKTKTSTKTQCRITAKSVDACGLNHPLHSRRQTTTSRRLVKPKVISKYCRTNAMQKAKFAKTSASPLLFRNAPRPKNPKPRCNSPEGKKTLQSEDKTKLKRWRS